ncbi:MAG TPA: lytic transglycosylase domain-containing protein [Beijerinckiaceae bacterium]|jgi:hypothetical protein
MNDRRTAAPGGAGVSRAPEGSDDGVRWLKPRGAWAVRAPRRRRRSLPRLVATLGVGSLLTISAPESAVGPAAAHTSGDLLDLHAHFLAMPAVEAPGGPGRPRQSFDLPALDEPAGLAPELHAVRNGDAPQPVASAAAPRPEEPDFGVAGDFSAGAFSDGADPNEILRFGGVRIPRRLVQTILRAANVTGVDPTYMMALADKESSFLVDNKASTSSAEGLFQFVEKTWLEVVRDFGGKYGMDFAAASVETVDGRPGIQSEPIREWVLGLRRNPYLSAVMAAEMLKRDKTRTERRIGRPLDRSELYLMHFLGAESAAKLLELVSGKPKQSAPKVFPAAAKANRTLFFAQEVVKQKKKTRHLTVSEVYGRIDRMIDARLDRYEGVAAFAPVGPAFALQ